MTTDSRSVIMAHLMADYRLDYNPLFFGQFALVQDWADQWREIDGQKLRHCHIGSRVAGPSSIQTPDPLKNRLAYREALADLCRNGYLVFAVSHFIHKDGAALIELAELIAEQPNFRLIIMLHCTRDEFLRPGSQKDHCKRALRRSQRVLAFKEAVSVFSAACGKSIFVAVSEAARRSYVNFHDDLCLPSQRVVSIPNGVNEHHYTIADRETRTRRRQALALNDGMLIGCTNRWTRAKGKDILEALLDLLEKQADQEFFTFLFPALVHDDLFDFMADIPGRYPRLFAKARVRAFLDISGLVHSAFKPDLDKVKRQYMQDLQSQPERVTRVFNRIFMGFLPYPVHSLLDVFLRPSIVEAFGLGTVEAYLCGVPVLASDRGGSCDLVLSKHQVAFLPELNLQEKTPNPTYDRAVRQAAKCFHRQLQILPHDKIPDPWYRSRMIRMGMTTSTMIRAYNRLLMKMLKVSHVK